MFGFCYQRIESDNESSLAQISGIRGIRYIASLVSAASLINPEMAAILAIGDNVVVNMSLYLDINLQNFQQM